MTCNHPLIEVMRGRCWGRRLRAAKAAALACVVTLSAAVAPRLASQVRGGERLGVYATAG